MFAVLRRGWRALDTLRDYDRQAEREQLLMAEELRADRALYEAIKDASGEVDVALRGELGLFADQLALREFALHPPQHQRHGRNFMCSRCLQYRGVTLGSVWLHLHEGRCPAGNLSWKEAKATKVLWIGPDGVEEATRESDREMLGVTHSSWVDLAADLVLPMDDYGSYIVADSITAAEILTERYPCYSGKMVPCDRNLQPLRAHDQQQRPKGQR